MRAWQRWLAVGLGLAILLSLPSVLGALPAADSDVGATELLEQVRDSGEVPFSGYAESVGGLQLPVTRDFTDLVDLFGERSRMRVWWRGSEDWRMDTLSATGETDLFHRAGATLMWDYEDNRATLSSDPDIRLPRTADLLPTELGRRLLSEATAEEVTRIPPIRVAGRDAPGLRLQPADSRTTVDRVDVWVDPQSGLPLRVQVHGVGSDTAALTSTFLELTVAPPSESDTSFITPTGAEFRFEDVIDVAAAADQFAPAVAPDRLAGLDRRTDESTVGALGAYGRGVTLLAAVPIWDEISRPLRDQLEATPGARIDEQGVYVSVGPLGLLLTPGSREQRSWLIAGTVTSQTLADAATDVARIPVADG
ncbi:MAG: transcriptional regulator [Geodermatophilaceae bacterium]|nr:transcriptional regulator [Geodermatophilaceae bacterium]